jgi:DNA polymerase I-like protein with 3'-5' exonuclease and polymerase domains
LIFNVPESQKEQARDIVQELMENTTKISVPLKAPAEIGYNWKEAH